MGYKLKEKPEIVYWLETKQFTIVDDEGKEYEIRIGESSKDTETFIWNEPGGWDELNNGDLWLYLNEGFSEDEWDLEKEDEKERHKKMDEIAENFVATNGEIKDLNQLDDLIRAVNKETDFHKKYGERMYDSYRYVLDFLKKRGKNEI